MTLNELLQVLCTAADPIDRYAQPIWIYEFDDDVERYDEIDWDNQMIYFCIIPCDYKPEAYLKPEFANAKVDRVWAIPGQPVKVGIFVKRERDHENEK